ncbi:hypothetical protein P7C70_g6885, partial [Phenoliferia sp. Uapishka_3]
MVTVHSLAPELLSNIFEHLHDPRKPSTTVSASLVCRAWRREAQRILFADIAMGFLDPENSDHEKEERPQATAILRFWSRAPSAYPSPHNAATQPHNAEIVRPVAVAHPHAETMSDFSQQVGGISRQLHIQTPQTNSSKPSQPPIPRLARWD